jgi:suppressor of G2 allele of SKP1
MKVELEVTKAEAGSKWRSWGHEIEQADQPVAEATPTLQQVQANLAAKPDEAPKEKKNWDKFEADEEEEDGVDDFMKKIYQGATPDQQRAMMKSYIESGGTALSTDWSSVKKGKVEVQPPEGVEVKKW